MSMRRKKLKFWGQAVFAFAAIAVGISIFCCLIMLLEGEGQDRGFGTLPFAVLFAGILMIIPATNGLFQVYFPVLLSLGEIRRRIVRTFFLSIGGLVMLLTGLEGLAWLLASRKEAFSIGPAWLAVAAGLLFAAAAFGMASGAVIVRWRKIGILFLVLLCALAGGVLGVGLGGTGVMEELMRLFAANPAILGAAAVAAGATLYLLSALFVRALTRWAEARFGGVAFDRMGAFR